QRSQNATPPSRRTGRPAAVTSAAIEEASSRISARIRGGLAVTGRPSPRRISSSLRRELLIDEAYVHALPLTQVQRHVVEQQAEDDQRGQERRDPPPVVGVAVHHQGRVFEPDADDDQKL